MFQSSLFAIFQTIVLSITLLGSFPSQAGEAEELIPLPKHPAVQDFTLSDVAGNRHRLSDYKGQVIMVTFWASWCPQCLWEMPSIQFVWESLKQSGFLVLAVNVGEDLEKVSDFTSRSGISFPVLLDRDLAVYKEWPILGLPTTYLLDRQGFPVYRVVGAVNWQDKSVIEVIRRMLSSTTSSQE